MCPRNKEKKRKPLLIKAKLQVFLKLPTGCVTWHSNWTLRAGQVQVLGLWGRHWPGSRDVRSRCGLAETQAPAEWAPELPPWASWPIWSPDVSGATYMPLFTWAARIVSLGASGAQSLLYKDVGAGLPFQCFKEMAQSFPHPHPPYPQG